MATVYICQASIDERGKAYGGAAGDQTGREVYRRTWYDGNWSVLLRPRNKIVARKMVAFAEAVCAGNMVGYDQWQRNTLRDVARAASWDGSKLATKCETDCSAFMTVAAEAAGIDMDKTYTKLSTGQLNAPVTQTMRNAFCSTGAFIALTDASYLKSTDYLEAGDVLVRESGHTCMVVTDGPKAITPTFATLEVETISPVSLQVTTKTEPLNARSQAANGDIVGTFSRGEVVIADKRVYSGATAWYHCTNGVTTGWACGDYLAEVEPATEPAKETEGDMDISELLARMTDEQAACLVDKALKYYAKLPESEWAKGELDDAVEMGFTDGQRPRAFCTREEAALMVKRAIARYLKFLEA